MESVEKNAIYFIHANTPPPNGKQERDPGLAWRAADTINIPKIDIAAIYIHLLYGMNWQSISVRSAAVIVKNDSHDPVD